MDINLIERKISKTKAIVAVHFTGYMTNMVGLKKFQKNKTTIVEDACQSIFTYKNNKNAGTWKIGADFFTLQKYQCIV